MKKTTPKKQENKTSQNISYTSYRSQDNRGNTYSLEEYRRKREVGSKKKDTKNKNKTKSVATPATKPVTKQTSKTAAKPTTKQTSKAATKPVTKQTSKAATKPVTKQASKPATKQASKQQASKVGTKSKQRSTSQETKQAGGYTSTYNSERVTVPTPEQRRAEMKKKNQLTRKQIQQLKEKKRKAYRLKLICVSVMIMFFVYGGLKLVQAMSYPKVSYQTVQMGVIDNSKKLEGLVVRDEKVVNSSATGNLHYLVNEGQKVAKNKEVAMVVENEVVENLGAQLEDVDRSIYNIQEKRENLSSYQPELYSLNTLVSKQMNQFYNHFDVMDTNHVYVLRKELNHIIQARTNIYVQDENSRTEKLQADHVNLEQDIQGKKNISYAKHAGIVSYAIDKQEEKLSSAIVKELKYDGYKDLLNGSKKSDGAQTILNAELNQPLYKIVTSDQWQIVTYISIDEGAQYEKNKKYELIFPELGNMRVQFVLTEKEEENNKVKLVFQTRDQITKFLGERRVEFTIGETRAEGLKIPLQAILEKNLFPIPEDYVVEQNHEKGVLRQKGETAEFIPIYIQYKEDGKVFIIQEMNKTSALMVGDTLKHPENTSSYTLKDVVTEKGVYTVNGRYAQFKPVEVIMQNEEYGILSNGGKTKLKEFDQIISNPKGINQDQLLRSMNVQNE